MLLLEKNGKITDSITFRNNIAGNVLPLAAVGDFGALQCQPSTNVDRSTALDLTTSAPIAANGCYGLVLLSCIRLFFLKILWFTFLFSKNI